MSKYLVLLSTLGAAFADYSPWAPIDATVTKVVSRTAYVCPCDGSTSYDPDWNIWEGPNTYVSGTSKTWSGSYSRPTSSTRSSSSSTPSTSITLKSPSTSTRPLSFTKPTEFTTRCYTDMTSSPAPYGTSWSTSYTSCTSIFTTIVSTTVSLPTSTITASTTITATSTAPSTTLTATSIAITTTTTTTTETDTTTEATTIVSTSTSTVPASSGFIPIQTSLPGSTYSGSGGADPIAKRNIEVAHQPRKIDNSTSPANGLGLLFADMKYPKAVSCIAWLPTQCSSITTTITSTQTASPSTTITNTMTITSTIFPSATTTITTTSTNTETTTKTTITTTTSTSTSVVAGPTLYAECATNNLADMVNGAPIVTTDQTNGDRPNIKLTTAATAYDCCVAGLALANNVISIFSQSQNNMCQLSYADTCPTGQMSNTFVAYTISGALVQYVFSNLNCGQFNSVFAG